MTEGKDVIGRPARVMFMQRQRASAEQEAVEHRGGLTGGADMVRDPNEAK